MTFFQNRKQTRNTTRGKEGKIYHKTRKLGKRNRRYPFRRRYSPQRTPNPPPPLDFASYTTRVPRVTGISQESGSDTLDCMLSNCREEVFNCAKNPQCRACISCLEGCPPNDQVILHEEKPLPETKLLSWVVRYTCGAVNRNKNVLGRKVHLAVGRSLLVMLGQKRAIVWPVNSLIM